MLNRIQKTQTILKKDCLDALLISSAINIRYLTGFDGFGTHEREGFGLLTNSNLYIFADPRLAEGARTATRGKKIEVVELTAQKKLVPTLKEIIIREKIAVIGFEENLTFAELKRIKKAGGKWKLTEDIVEDVRIVKDKDELASLKKACKLTDEAYTNALDIIRAGMTELDLAWIIERFIREHGGELAFPTIVAFGKNSAIPHHKVSSQKLEVGSCILLDFGARVDGYCADMTRTVFFGKADEKFKKIYNAVLESQLKGLNLLNDKSYIIDNRSKVKLISPEQIDQAARQYIISQGYPPVPHSVGHGVGLEVHELPHISPGFKDQIKPGTPFTIEPGIYLNGYGGVRIEDTVLINGNKIETLTKSPTNLIEINSK